MNNMSITSQKSILVCALQGDGKGDIYGAHEIFLRVKKLMPETKIVFAVVQPNFFGPMNKILAKYGKAIFEDVSEIQKKEKWEIVPTKEVFKTITTFQRIIVFPTADDEWLPSEILQCNANLIRLREYGAGDPEPEAVNGPTYTLGLNKEDGEHGVLLPLKFSEKLPEHKEETPLQRLSHLQKVHPTFSKAILGSDFSTDAIQKFNQTHKLYFGYYFQEVIFFCYVKALMKCKEGNLVICAAKKRPENLLDKIKSTAWKLGFRTFNVIEFKNEKEFQTSSSKFKGSEMGKTCTFIFRTLPETEMDIMLDATEDESLTTGDNSPLRAMAHRKTIVYDARAHKIPYAQSIIALATKHDPHFTRLLSMAFFGQIEQGPDYDLEQKLDLALVDKIENGMVELFKAMQDPSLKANWYRYIEDVFANYDFTPQLKMLLQQQGRAPGISQEQFEKWKRDALEGSATAQYNLGGCYLKGIGVHKSLFKAFQYFKVSADQGCAEAQIEVGKAFEEGVGIDKSPEQAFHYYKLAADQEHPLGIDSIARGLLYVARAYREGVWVEKSPEQAAFYFNKYFVMLLAKADAGNAQFQAIVGIYFEQGEELPQSIKKAIHYYQLAADQNDPTGLFCLASCYAIGRGVPRSYEKALNYYRLAADHGNVSAQSAIELLSKDQPTGSSSHEIFRKIS